MEQNYTSPFEIKTKLEYAEPGRRFLAFMLDGLIIGGLFWLIRYWIRQTYAVETQEYYIAMLIFSLTRGISYWLYFALMESSSKQATLGKMAYGIRVTDLEGNRISFGQASTRYFSKFLSVLILFYGFIMILRNDKRQGLHDKIAKTVVVY